jgi:nitrate reductase NapAB chaperone NapD
MAISGILVHCLKKDLDVVEQQVSSMEELTTYGIHEDAYVVAVVETPSEVIEKVVKKIGSLDGVLTVYTTYLTIEDEIDDDGNLTTNLSATQHMKMEPRQDD